MSPKTAAHLIPVDEPAETPFYIAATQQAATRPPRALKYGDTFVVLDSRGDISATSGGTAGLFHLDTRHLSRLELLVNSVHPLLLGSNLRDDNSAFSVDLSNPDLMADQRIVLEKDTVHILRTMFLWRSTAYQRLGVRNYGDRAVDLQVSILFENDFADLFEVRGSHRERRGTATANLRGADQALLIYRGLDNKVRRTGLTFDPPPSRLTTSAAVYELHLEPGETRPLFLAVSCDAADARPRPFLPAFIAARRELREATRTQTSVETSNERFNEMLCRSAADLAMLMTDTPQGRYPYAGIPWFSTTFGRDGLITALQMLWWSPDVARGVLRRLAAYQAKTADPLADAEPGKILHEMRGGEMAALREVPFGLYYGSVDATPLFVLLAGPLCRAHRRSRNRRRAVAERSRRRSAGSTAPAIRDGDGFVEYERANEQGLVNQGWKDSHDAIFHADGRLAEGPIALAEVQGYVYAAKRMAARLRAAARKRCHRAPARRRSEPPRRAFRGGVLVPGDRAPTRWRSTARRSRAGCAPRMPARCCSPASPPPSAPRTSPAVCCRPHFFSGWGIRTVARERSALQSDVVSQRLDLAARQRADRAGAWRATNRSRRSQTLFEGLFDAATYMDLPPAAGTVLRLPAPPRPRADALSGRLLAAGLGQRHAVHAFGSLARPPIRSVQGRDPAVQSAPAGVPRRRDPARFAPRFLERRSACAAA